LQHEQADFDIAFLSSSVLSDNECASDRDIVHRMRSFIMMPEDVALPSLALPSRGRPRKFTVKTRQQSGRQILVSKILFTRFTDSVIFLDFCRNYYAWLGRFWGLDKSIFGEERGIFEILTWY
jgi:hypothetical protein